MEMFIITRGAVTRTRLEEREHEHENLGSKGSEATVGALHLLHNEPYYATVRCSQDVVCYALSSVEPPFVNRVGLRKPRARPPY